MSICYKELYKLSSLEIWGKAMKKEILLGSIIAVVILTLVSFTSVVGYSSVKSDLKIASPLFSIRNNKCDISSNYLGKGKAINIPLPKRNDNVNPMYRMIDFISKANDKTFERYLDLVCSRLRPVNGFTNEKIDEIIEQFRYIREYPDEVKSVVVNDNIRNDFILNDVITLNLVWPFPFICSLIVTCQIVLAFLFMLIEIFWDPCYLDTIKN